MRLQQKNILLISSEPWDHIFVSKHHYAVHLGKNGNKVFFLNPPSVITSVSNTNHSNVFSVNYTGFPRGLKYYPSVLSRYLIGQKYLELQRLCGVSFDVVWSFDNSVFFDFSALPKNVVKICHVVDLNQDYNTSKAASTADICIGVISKIVDRLRKYNSSAYLIAHGVQPFAQANPVALPGQNTVKAIYIGNLSMPHIDWLLIEVLAIGNSDVDFVFIGSDAGEHNAQKAKVFALPNVHRVPSVPAETIPSYLASADIMLLCYTDHYYRNFATPHKMMEYLASGKVIVSTFAADYDMLRKQGLVAMDKDWNNLSLLFSTVVRNLHEWNSLENAEKRRRIAADNSYDKQIERIERLLK